MKLFGRELSLEQMIGFVECSATPDEDLVHRAALELIAELRESKRRADAAVELMPRECRTCAHWDKSKGKPYGCKLGGCVSLNRPEQWQWRGLQEAEKGVTENG